MSHARYLGDSVYASFNGNGITLTTGHHDPLKAVDVICLEPEVVEAFKQYENDLMESLKRGETRQQI